MEKTDDLLPFLKWIINESSGNFINSTNIYDKHRLSWQFINNINIYDIHRFSNISCTRTLIIHHLFHIYKMVYMMNFKYYFRYLLSKKHLRSKLWQVFLHFCSTLFNCIIKSLLYILRYIKKFICKLMLFTIPTWFIVIQIKKITYCWFVKITFYSLFMN